MPVPSFSPIADSELDPESPITSSLMFRLRDNLLALFGIDTTDPSPTPAGPTSYDEAIYEIVGAANIYNTVHTTSELTVWVIPEIHAGLRVDGNLRFMIELSSGVVETCILDVSRIQVELSSGVPSGVRVRTIRTIGESSAGGGGSAAALSVLLPLNNTWTDIDAAVLGGWNLQGKARSDSNGVYLAFRSVTGSGGNASAVMAYNLVTSKLTGI